MEMETEVETLLTVRNAYRVVNCWACLALPSRRKAYFQI